MNAAGAIAVLAVAVLALLPAAGLTRPVDPPGANPSSVLVFDGTGLARGPALPAGAPIWITVSLRPQHEGELLALTASMLDPRSPGYHRFLSEPQFLDRFAPAPGNLSRLGSFLAAHGATDLRTTADRLGVMVRMTAAGVDSAFGVSLREVGSPARPSVYDVAGTPSLPPSIAPSVLGIGGLSDVANAHLLRSVAVHGSGPPRPERAHPGQFVDVQGTNQELFVGSDFTQAYGAAAMFPGGAVANSSFGSGYAVATLLTSGYNQTQNADLAPFDPVAVGEYFHDSFPPAWPVPNVLGVPVTIAGSTPPPPGPAGPLADDTLSVEENSLDLEMAGSIAPGANLVNFYYAESISANSNGPGYGDVADDFAQCLASALDHNYSPARLAVVSNSYGLPDLNDSMWNTELLHAAALGVTVVAASGDEADAPNSATGRFQGPDPIWPATVAFPSSGVLAVGGTAPILGGTPTGSFDPSQELNVSYDSNSTGITSESAWYDTSGGSGNYAGTEGGVSSTYAEPAWERGSAAQPAIVNATVLQQAPALGRAVPDVSLAAASTVVYVVNNSTGTYFDVLEGTSIAAPLVAGGLAVCDAVGGGLLGYFDPELYRIGSYYQGPGAGAAPPWTDIVSGGNYLFQAAPGWDPVTGWGSLHFDALAASLRDPTITDYTYTGPSPGLPHGYSPSPGAANGPPPNPRVVAVVLGVVAAAIAIAIFLAVRAETAHVPEPPPGAFGTRIDQPRPDPVRALCARCGQPRPTWVAVCPWCGAAP